MTTVIAMKSGADIGPADIERRHAGVYRLSDDERAAVRRGLADMRAGRIASDDAVSALFSHYGA